MKLQLQFALFVFIITSQRGYIMKKSKFFVLPLAALSLIACTGQNTSSEAISSTSSSTAQTTTSSSTGASSSLKPSSSPISTSSESSPSSSSVDYTAGWKNTIVDEMKKYLGGTVVPFYKLSSSAAKQYSSWDVTDTDFGILTVDGDGNIAWDSTTTANEIKTLFTNAGWTLDPTSGSTFVKAKDPTGKVTAEYEKNDEGNIVLHASYDEDYDLTSASAWDSEVLAEMNTVFETTLPYIYLGTKNPGYRQDKNVTTPNLTISGGKWNDKVLSDVSSSLLNLGYQVSIDQNTKILSATGKASNGIDSFQLELSKNSNVVDKIVLKVLFIEGFNPNAYSTWPDTSGVESVVKNYLHNHTIPVTYLGTKNPKANYSDASKCVIISGQTWNDSILTLAMQNWVKEGWEIDDDESTSSSPYVTFKKEIASDHCILTATIKKNYSDTPEIRITLDEGLEVPADCTDWQSNTKTLMQEKLNLVLPYFYMNTGSETANFDEASSTLTIGGGTWVSRVGDYGYNALDADENTVWELTQDEYSHAVTATAEVDGAQYSLTLKGDNYTKQAILRITYIPAYVVPESGEWTGTAKTQLDTNFAGMNIPYIYLRTTSPEGDYEDYNRCLTITGGVWDDAMITQARSAFTADDGWKKIKYDVNEYNPYFEAVKVFSAGYQVKVRLQRGYSQIAQLLVYKDSIYLDENQPTAYVSENKTTCMESLKTTLPYLYLGTNKEQMEYEELTDENYSYEGLLTITGECWSDKILTAAQTAFASWTNHIVNTEYGNAFVAYKTETVDGTNYDFVVVVYHDDENIPLLKCYRNKAISYSTTGTYSEDVQNQFASMTGNQTDITLPYVDLGTVTYNNRFVGSKTISQVQEIKFYETLLNDKQTVAGKEYAWENIRLSVEMNELMFSAVKSLPAGGKVKVNLMNKFNRPIGQDTGTYAGILTVQYSAPFVDEDGATAWNSEILSAMNDTFDNHVVPYFYMGDTSNTEINISDYESYPYISFSSSEWDDQIYTNMINALNEEGGWTYLYDYASVENTECLWASKTLDNGKHFTLQLIHVIEDEEEYASLYVYYR